MTILQIEDNGKGMHVTPNLMDLAGIKERAEALNGEFQSVPALGKGTTVTVKFPIN